MARDDEQINREALRILEEAEELHRRAGAPFAGSSTAAPDSITSIAMNLHAVVGVLAAVARIVVEEELDAITNQ